MNDERFNVLKKHLCSREAFDLAENDPQVDFSNWDTIDSIQTICTPLGDYVVLTDVESLQMATKDIMQTLWACRADFLARHLPLSEDVIRHIQKTMSEDANETFATLLDIKCKHCRTERYNAAALVAEALEADGHAHYIAHYDHKQHASDCGNFYIYRTH